MCFGLREGVQSKLHLKREGGGEEITVAFPLPHYCKAQRSLGWLAHSDENGLQHSRAEWFWSPEMVKCPGAGWGRKW